MPYQHAVTRQVERCGAAVHAASIPQHHHRPGAQQPCGPTTTQMTSGRRAAPYHRPPPPLYATARTGRAAPRGWHDQANTAPSVTTRLQDRTVLHAPCHQHDARTSPAPATSRPCSEGKTNCRAPWDCSGYESWTARTARTPICTRAGQGRPAAQPTPRRTQPCPTTALPRT